MSSTPFKLLEEDCEQGGTDCGIEEDFAYKNNVLGATIQIRLGFLRKVYALLTVQLLATVIIATTFMAVEPIKLYIQENPWMMISAVVLSFVFLISLHIYRRESPINFVLLAAFTIVEAYTVGVIVSVYDSAVVIQAFFLTMAVVFGITLFTFNTKKDFSSMYSIAFAGLLVLIVGGLIAAIVQSSVLDLCISVGGALLFSLFIIIDTQLIMKNLSPEEYILATITLYLDIINLFIYILRILQAARN